VKVILSLTGDWQKFKGLPAPTEPLRVAPERANRTAIYEAEAQAAAGVSGDSRAMKKAEPAKKAEPKKADAKKAEVVEEKKAEETPVASASPASEEPAGAGADQAS
jgi:small subunit ribosomal protein S16